MFCEQIISLCYVCVCEWMRATGRAEGEGGERKVRMELETRFSAITLVRA